MTRFAIGLILIQLLGYQINAQNVTSSRINYGMHVPLTAKFSNSSGDPYSWIGLYKSDAPDGAYTTYQYIEGKTNGEISFIGDYEPGLYNFRLFRDNGYARIATSGNFLIRNGMVVDPAFATNGFFKWNASSGTLYNSAIAARLTSNGKIVVGGQINTEKRSTNGAEVVDFSVTRLLANGTPDPSFGQNGKVTIVPVSSYFPIYPIAMKAIGVQGDGKIVIGGDVIITFTDNSLSYSVILIRLLENGQLDSSFGDKGVVLYNFKFDGEKNISVSDELKCLEITPDQKILVGGGSLTSAPYAPGRPFIGKFLSNGQPDLSFGGVGFVCPLDSILFRGYIESIVVPASGSSGYYAAATAAMMFGQNYQILYRFDQNGNLDKSFGTGGLFVEHKPGLLNDQTTKDLVLNPQGNLVLMGRNANYSYWLTAHNSTNGAYASGFGTNDQVIADPVSSCADIPSSMVSDNNRIHVAFTSCLRGIGLSRFFQNGQIDLSFGYSIFENRDAGGNYIEYTVQDFVQADTNKFILVGSARFYDSPHWETFIAAFKDNPEIIVSASGYEKSNRFVISQNYPNPFRDFSTIPMNLNKRCRVEVTLYDLQGRTIGSFYNGVLESGNHEIIITPPSHLKGSYIYKVALNDGENFYQESRILLIQ